MLQFIFKFDRGKNVSKCKYCNSSSYGYCGQSPHKKHEHDDSCGKKCVYCGSSSYGYCGQGPDKKHRHGATGKCRYCGSSSSGYCGQSPHKKHEK